MSAGHHHARTAVPQIDDAFYARVRNLVDACRRDRDHTIPWLANRSADGRIVWIDLIVPKILPRCGIDTGETLPYHELGEWLGMNEGLDYDTAHATKGNPCEKRRVEELGGDWEAYQAELAEYIRDVDDEAMTDVPLDIDRRVFVDDHDQAALAAIAEDNKGLSMTLVRKFVGIEATSQGLSERQIRVIASDPTVDHVKDVMVPEGCDTVDYQKNPIILAQHNREFPIGRAVVEIKNGRVEALINFAPAGVSAKADEYCGLAKAGIINAASVGFEPLEFEPIKDGGYRYTKWKLMEISLVSVPANPNAVVIGRAAPHQPGKAAAPEWKVGASRNLPIDADSAWDGEAAKASIFKQAGFDGDSPDTAYARKGFLVYDAAAPKLKGSYKLPFAQVKDGRLTALASGIRAAASRLPQTDIPDDVQTKARAVIDHYEAKMGDKAGRASKVKGLYDVACLCELVCRLGYLHDSACFEAECEGDNSKLPAMLAASLQSLCSDLLAMTAEEVGELLAGRVEPLVDDVAYVEAAATPHNKNLRAALRKARKAGRVLSQDNLDRLTAIQKCMGKAMDCYTKAADLHDDVHGIMEEWMNHGTSAGEHVKEMLKAAGRKPDNTDAAGNSTDDGSDDDQELAADVAARKRMVEVMERSAV